MQRPDRSLPPAPTDHSGPGHQMPQSQTATTPTTPSPTTDRGWFSSFKMMGSKPAMSRTWTKKGKDAAMAGAEIGGGGGSGAGGERETGRSQ